MSVFAFLRDKFLGNTVEAWLWFASILVFGLLFKRWISGRVSRLIYFLFEKYCKAGGIQKFLQLMTRPIEVFFTILIIYLAFDKLAFPDEWKLLPRTEFGFRLVLIRFFEAAIITSFFWILLRLVDFTSVILLERARKTETKSDDQLVPFVREGVKVIIAVIGLFVILSIVFHLDIVSLVAGLGIGGLAIALAAKETLENLFGSFAIFLDKPFTTGDFVKVGSVEGHVESVGFRSTRIRAADKMMITVPNKKMVEAELINETDRTFRRSSFSISLSFDTTEEQIKNIIADIRKVLSDEQLVENGTESVRFYDILQTGYEIRVIYIVLTPVMEEFLAVQEGIFFRIMRIVKNNNATFFTHTLFREEMKENRVTAGYRKISAGPGE